MGKRDPVTDQEGTSRWRDPVVLPNDHRRTPKKLMNGALGRGTRETLMKEHKKDCGFEKLPTRKFHANGAGLWIAQLAWTLVAWFSRRCLPKPCPTRTLGTRRHGLLKVAAQIVHQSRQFFLGLSEEKLFQDWGAFGIKQLAHFKPISP